jgi:hypothetical protein
MRKLPKKTESKIRSLLLFQTQSYITQPNNKGIQNAQQKAMSLFFKGIINTVYKKILK